MPGKTYNPYRLDSGETAFFNRQLEYIKAQTYDTKQKKLKAIELLPVSFDAPVGAKEITFRQYTQVGVAKIVQDYANDFPSVDVYGVEKSARVRSIADKYSYSIQEIREAQMAGVSLNQRRANTARRAIDEKIDSIAWSGDADHNLQGFINYPGISAYTVPNGAAGTATWSTKTPDEIVADVTGLVDAVVSTTNGVEAPNTLILPISQYLLINDTRMTGDSNMTILQFILKNNVFIERIDWVAELAGAGVGSTDRAMVYNMDPEYLTLEIPQPFEQFEADKENMSYHIPCHARCGGVIVYYPLSIAYGDGI